MSAELLPLLSKISSDIGEVKGSVDGLRDLVGAHVAQDQIVQAKLFERLGALEVAHAGVIAHAVTVKSIAAGLGTAGGILGAFLAHLWPWYKS